MTDTNILLVVLGVIIAYLIHYIRQQENALRHLASLLRRASQIMDGMNGEINRLNREIKRDTRNGFVIGEVIGMLNEIEQEGMGEDEDIENLRTAINTLNNIKQSLD